MSECPAIEILKPKPGRWERQVKALVVEAALENPGKSIGSIENETVLACASEHKLLLARKCCASCDRAFGVRTCPRLFGWLDGATDCYDGIRKRLKTKQRRKRRQRKR